MKGVKQKRDRISKGTADTMEWRQKQGHASEGLVDPDFDKIEDHEVESILGSVGAHNDRAEDYD